MLEKAMLVNLGNRSLGVLAVDTKDTIVHYGGGYFARTPHERTEFLGQSIPIFRQPETIYCTNKLDYGAE